MSGRKPEKSVYSIRKGPFDPQHWICVENHIPRMNISVCVCVFVWREKALFRLWQRQRQRRWPGGKGAIQLINLDL